MRESEEDVEGVCVSGFTASGKECEDGTVLVISVTKEKPSGNHKMT